MSPARESVGGVLGVGTGLALLLACALAALGFRGGDADPGEILAVGTTLEAPPAGTVVDAAVQLPGGDRMLKLLVEDPAALGLEGSGPDALLLAAYRSAKSAKAQVDARHDLDHGKRRRWEGGEALTFRETIAAGDLEWDRLGARFVLEREYRADGAAVDTVKVDLSRPGAPFVLFATWPDGVDADEERLVPALRALALKSLDDQGAS